jgi:hypothetical protein
LNILSISLQLMQAVKLQRAKIVHLKYMAT